MAINPLCCYGLQRNATDLKPQASQTQPQHLKVKKQGKKKKTEMKAKSRRKIKKKKTAVLHSGRECLI